MKRQFKRIWYKKSLLTMAMCLVGWWPCTLHIVCVRYREGFGQSNDLAAVLIHL